MAGDLGKHGQRDPIRVNILEAQELQAWCAEFGCTADQLKTAVGRAGVMAIDVRDWSRPELDFVATSPARLGGAALGAPAAVCRA